MLTVNHISRVFLYSKDVDMRRSFDGLHAIVQAEFRRDIRLGDYFMFINKRRDRMKVIWWDRDGLAIFAKRLESGTFQRLASSPSDANLSIDHAQLAMLLSGIDVSNIKRRKRYVVHQETLSKATT